MERVRVLEPPRDQPAATMPFFSTLLGSSPGGRTLWLFGPLFAAMASVPFLLGRFGLLIAAGLLLGGALWALWAGYRAAPWTALSALAKSSPFVELSLPPDGLFADGAKVYFQLPDAEAEAEWAEVRLPEAARLQLTAQRRAWLLGPDDEECRFLQLPGVLWPYHVKTVPELPDGARLQDAVEPRLVSPEEDKVLVAHRKRIVRRIRSLVALWVLVIVLAVAGQIVSFISISAIGAVGTLFYAAGVFGAGIMPFDSAKKMLKPLPRGEWTEMVAVPNGTGKVGSWGLATSAYLVQWPDGAWSEVLLSKVDPSLPANIWATQRLWVIGEPARGTEMFAGVPGHAVLGRVEFS